MANGTYLNMHSSLLRFCKTMAGEFVANNITDKCSVFDFESHASIEDLPSEDMVGLSHFSLDIDDPLITGDVMITVAVGSDDKNLQRLRPMIDHLYETFKKEKHVELVDSDTGACYGYMRLKDKMYISPVEKNTIRPVAGLGFEVVTDFLTPPGQ